MTAIKKYAIPGLILHGIMTVACGILGYELIMYIYGGGFDLNVDTSGYGEMGMIFILIIGVLYLAALVPMAYAIGSGLNFVFKLLQLTTGKWGFAVPSVILDGGALLLISNLFVTALSMNDGWIVAIPLGILMAAYIVSFVFDIKTFKAKNQP